MRSFIGRGKSMDRDDFDYTALHYAARNGNVEICKMLIEDGKADVDAITKAGATALHRAAMMGNYIYCTQLIGILKKFCVGVLGHLNVVKLLVGAKANLQLQDEYGQTALHRAAIRGHLDVCKFLLEHDPKLKEIKDKKEKIPYEYIMENANDDFKILLKS